MKYDEFLDFLKYFEEIKSFAGKFRSANENLTRIGSGSGRIVFDIDGDKVFKLAKNQKGVAQNEAEINIGTDYYAQSIVTKVYEYADNYFWIIAEKAKKVSEKRIKELTGIPSLNQLYQYLKNFESENKGGRAIFSIESSVKESLDENEFIHDLLDLMNNYNVISGDLGRPSSYGEVLRDGQPTIVVTDYGLSDEVYNTHYSPERKQPYRMYELYNFADGNDDILSDIGNTDVVRQGMWALMPQGVGDGDEPMDDEFISYVQERNKYPNKSISNLAFLNDKFHECVNNLKETLNRTSDKKKFYNNLLALQEYLISQGVYDREKIELQEYVINEQDAEIPNVKRFSLDDKEYATQLVNAAVSKLGLKVVKYLGGGSNGFAFDIGNGKVFKISTDIGEADAASKLLREKPVRIATVYNLYKIVDTEKNLSYFGIIEENIENKPKDLFFQYHRIINTIKPNNMAIVDFFILMKKMDFNYDNLVQLAEGILNQNPDANISPELRQEAYNYLIGLLEIKKELVSYNIKSNDYSNPENLGYSNGVLKYFDFGAYRADEPNVDNNVIMLPENVETINEVYEREIADSIANQIATKFNLSKPVYISGGTVGVAYDIGNDKVLKITKDNSEASENQMLIGKQLNYIAEPYRVLQISSKNTSIPNTYAIILEKLKTSPEIERLYNRLNYVFGSILDVKVSDVVEEYLGYGDESVDREKVDAYLRKNPQDAKFFNGLVNIAKEAQGFGIESLDFYNWRNLGYKKNGALGFFDVGFGNGFLQPHGAETLEVAENFGGSSLYSTTNTIGSDDTPTYNQNDTSPLTDNNIPTSIDDLNERQLSSMKGSSTVEVKKKCRLGGLGNTSAACNQGDINNLIIKSINEEIDASEAYTTSGAINAMIDGKKDVGLFHFKYNDGLKEKLIKLDFGLIKIEQNNHNVDMNIVYRKTNRGIQNAQRLYNIMKSMGGYVSDETPKEAYEIGKLLDYSEKSILKYINRIYIKEKNGTFRRRNNDELKQYDMKSIDVINEANIYALSELPFKEEVQQLGGKIYSVGGAVRDEFLGKESKDLDILISGIPMDKLEEILSKYGRVDAVGKSFGILKFKPEGSTEDIDIAIPRTEKPTGEGGHKGFEVSSSHELPIEKDLERRDFTINAIAKDVDGNIIDPFGGQNDLQNKIIRIVNPEAFSDDPLRMLRAIQFASRFGFKIESKTMKMIQDNASRIKEIPPERILTEFDKIVKKGNMLTGAFLLKQTGLLKNIFGKDSGILVGQNVWENVKTMGEFIYLLSHNLVDSAADFYKNNMKGDINTYKEIKALEIAFSKQISNIVEARAIAHNMYLNSPQSLNSQILPDILKTACQELLTNKYPKTIGELAVNGNDLMQLGLKGKEIGDALKMMLIKIYSDKIRNNKNELLLLIQ